MGDRESRIEQQKQDQDFTPDTGMIQRQLDQILASQEFKATRRQREFLRFVVSETIAGKGDQLKAYSVATQVFGRGEDFNQATDPIVSIQANQLRRALERYYLVAGEHDPIYIDIPKGSYAPRFVKKTPEGSSASSFGKAAVAAVEESWPSVLILPFQNRTGGPGNSFLGAGISTEIAVEVSRFQEIRVIFQPEGCPTAVSAGTPRFVLGGSIDEDSNGIKITAHLTDTRTGENIWGETQRANLEPRDFLAFQERVAQEIAVKTTGELGIIPRIASAESRNKPPAKLQTYEAILRYYEYDRDLSPVSFSRALQALEYAVHAEPDCGHIWSLLARLYGTIYGLDIPGFEKPIEKAVEYAQNGVRLNPNNQRALGTLALVRFLDNELSAARETVNRAIDLNPNSLLLLDGLAYILTLSGQWERGAALIKNSIQRNPYYRPVVHYALWADCLRRKDYEGAYVETMSLRRDGIFWYPLAKASALGLLGRVKEGERFTQMLLELKPDFSDKGRDLIGRYVKFEEIAECIREGLRNVGLNMRP